LCLEQGHRLGGDHVHQGPALPAREDRRIDFLGPLLVAQDHAAPRPTQRLVGRGGEDVGLAHRTRVNAARDEPRDVGDVGEQHGAHLVGDGAEGVEVDLPGIGGVAALDELRPALLREFADDVEVDALVVPAHAVVDDVVELAREVHRAAVGQVAAVVEIHGKYGVAHVEHGAIDGFVGLGARVGLHVHVVDAEDRLRTLARDVFDLVHHVTAAVVTLARVALGVLVGEDCAGRFQHGVGDEVLRGDQFDGEGLTLRLLANQARDRGVDVFETNPR